MISLPAKWLSVLSCLIKLDVLTKQTGTIWSPVNDKFVQICTYLNGAQKVITKERLCPSLNLRYYLQKKHTKDKVPHRQLRASSGVKNTGCSSRGPRFNFQHPYSVLKPSQPSLTLVLENPGPPFHLCGHPACMVHSNTCRKKHTNKISILKM